MSDRPSTTPAADLDPSIGTSEPAATAADGTSSTPVLAPDSRNDHRRKATRRRWGLFALRLGILGVLLGAWQVGVHAGSIDPFFWGDPVGVWQQLVEWATVGTPQPGSTARVSM